MTASLPDFPKASLEEVPCSLCGASAGAPLFTIRGFPILRCQSCGARYVSPRLKAEALAEMYSQENYYKSDNSLTHGYVNYVGDRENIVATFARRLKWLLAQTGRATPGKVLDVGCATGFSIDYALGQGWDAWGIEPSAYAASVAKERLGDRVKQGTLDRHTLAHESFDTVLLWDVIEHVPDPLLTLSQTRALLKPGGFLSLITPDVGSLVARLMGRRWMEYAKPTEHIIFFSRETIRRALERSGFEVIAWTTAGKWVGWDFLFDRLKAAVPMLQRIKSLGSRVSKAPALYIDPRDKLHVLARKLAGADPTSS